MNSKNLGYISLGVSVVALIVALISVGTVWTSTPIWGMDAASDARTGVNSRADAIPTLTPAPRAVQTSGDAQAGDGESMGDLAAASAMLNSLYQQLNPGVVNIQVVANSADGSPGVGAGSGFVFDADGYIVTNNHVVAGANQVIVNFYNGLQAEAEIIGTDDDSDLAIIKVDALPEDVHLLPIADSDAVNVGDWVLAIGNPYGLSSSMTQGIVSAIGRSIPSGATPFSIPQAIQTDAAINPGNSGGPLLNLAGQVIGVNAQIRTGSGGGNTGVGFAIPSNVVRHVAPVLVAEGAYTWPWLGVSGAPIQLSLMEANDLLEQRGAYIVEVVPNGPADEAGLRGAAGFTSVDGLRVPVGGDVVLAINGETVQDFEDLTNRIAFLSPNETVVFTILRDGQQREIEVDLAPRPDEFGTTS